MRHPDASLAAYIDGTATARERATAEAHLAECASCRREVPQAKAARAAAASLPTMAAPRIDVAAVIQVAVSRSASAAARPTVGRAAAPPAVDAPALGAGVMATPEWAPESTSDHPAAGTSTQVPEPAAPRGPDAAGEPGEAVQGATVTELPGEEDRARRKRDRDRAWELRVAQAALGAAAILVAIVLFVGLRTEPESKLGGAAGSPPASFPSPSVPADNAFGAATAFNQARLKTYAQNLAAQIDATDAVRQATATPAEREAALKGGGSPAHKELACLQEGTGLVGGNRLYQLLEATYLGQPVYIGAFLADVRTEEPTLLVLVVAVDGCENQGILREDLQAASP
jgi:hypothetical protein